MWSLNKTETLTCADPAAAAGHQAPAALEAGIVEAIELEMKENPILEMATSSRGTRRRGNTEEKREMKNSWSVIRRRRIFPGEEKEAPDLRTWSERPIIQGHLRWQIGLSDFDAHERVVAG